ncbi:MAG TPA: SdrD B-like domain-containing protein, partial [Candidatus Entotheonella sp.]
VEVNPAGYSSTVDSSAPNNDRVPVVLTNADRTGNDFLDTLLRGISGQVRYDADNDGHLADSDSGLAGAEVSLFTDPNGDGNPADGVQVGGTVTTDGTGDYAFLNLPPGNYVVVEVNPAGYSSTADSAAPNNDRIPVSLSAAGDSTGNDFLDTNVGTISGQVRNDVDHDGTIGGIADAEDTGLAGATVTLYTDPNQDGDPADGVQVGSPIVTDATGIFSFSNILAGDYVVVETDPASYTSVMDKDGDTTPPGYHRIPIGLAAGAANTGNDFLDVSSDRIPVADPDTNTATENGPAVNGNVLTNETSLGDEPTTVTAADQGGTAITIGAAFTTTGGGSLTINSDGTYAYTPPAWDLVPPAGLVEIFNYTITDVDGDISSTTLTITVSDTDRLPTADPDTNTATENGPAVNGNVMTNETSLGDEPTTVTAADQGGTAVTIGTAFTTIGGGSLTINSDGTYSYTPPAWDLVPPAGLVETFNYTITDVDGDTSNSTLTITVNNTDRLPVADPDTDTATENGPAVNGNVLTNETS